MRLEGDVCSQGIFRWKTKLMLVSVFLPHREKGSANIGCPSEKMNWDLCVCAFVFCICSDFSTKEHSWSIASCFFQVVNQYWVVSPFSLFYKYTHKQAWLTFVFDSSSMKPEIWMQWELIHTLIQMSSSILIRYFSYKGLIAAKTHIWSQNNILPPKICLNSSSWLN